MSDATITTTKRAAKPRAKGYRTDAAVATAIKAGDNQLRQLLSQSVGALSISISDGLRRTGIDIESGTITANADNFRVVNSDGNITAEVDASGTLAVNALVCRDANGIVRRTANELGNGWDIYYDTAGLKSLEVGWDGASVMRVYQRGSLKAMLGIDGTLQPASGMTSLTLAPYIAGNDAQYYTTQGQGLAGQSYYKSESSGLVYGDTALSQSSLIPDGSYIEAGLALFSFNPGGGAIGTRSIYSANGGALTKTATITWTIDNNGNIITQ